MDPGYVRLQNVSKRFGAAWALRDVTLSVPRGQVCGLLGPNGAGKTTLFRLLMGILKATHGQLQISGLDAFDERVVLKSRVGYLPDEPIFYSYLSGREVLELSAGMHGLDPRAVLERLAPLVARMQLEDALPRYADEYSRGMKKKLGLLLAMLHEPELLILDEPTNGLDVESMRLCFELIEEASASGTTILLSSHLMDHVERACSHVAVIRSGSLAFVGSLAELRERHGPTHSLEELFLELVAQRPGPA